MRKYKFAMQVGKNLQDIMNLDCVTAIRKRTSESLLHGCVVESVRTWFEVDLKDGSIARPGDWILKDACDNWHVMCQREYDEHKDDEI